MPFAECNAFANLIKHVVKKLADSALKRNNTYSKIYILKTIKKNNNETEYNEFSFLQE